MPFHVAGTLPDGTRVLTEDAAMPTDDTVVWVEGSDERTTVGEFTGEVEWLSEPEPARVASLCGVFDRVTAGVAALMTAGPADDDMDLDELDELAGEECGGCDGHGCEACEFTGYDDDEAAEVASLLGALAE